MEEPVVDIIEMGVQLGIAALVLVSIIGIGVTTNTYQSHVSDERAIQAEIQEYREFNQYDNKSGLKQGDIIQAIKAYSSMIRVEVDCGEAGWRNYGPTTGSDQLLFEKLQKLISNDYTYYATVKRMFGDSGEVTTIEFKRE